MDEIAHLDFSADHADTRPLRQRALDAYQAFCDAQRGEIIHHAQIKVAAVLGDAIPSDAEVTITNVTDGDGEVAFTIDSIDLKAKVVFASGRDLELDAEPQTVTLSVQLKGGSGVPINSLAELGKYLNAGRIE